MNEIREALIRTFAFVRKELFEMVRQPRLVLLLVLGPFLILLIFGVGYTNANRTLRTLIVVPPNSVIRDEVEAFAQQLPGLAVQGLVESEDEADIRLLDGEVDLVIITPVDPLADILAGNRALIEFQHREIDPIERLYVSTLERAYVNTVNREVLVQAADAGKERLTGARPAIAQALSDATALQSDLRRRNIASAAADLDALAGDVRLITAAIGSGAAVFQGIQVLELGSEGSLTGLQESVNQLDRLLNNMGLESQTDVALDQQAENVGGIVTELIRIQGLLGTVESLRSSVVARPFEGSLVSLSGVVLGPIDFFVPGTIALLLQHVTVTLAALSVVREKRGGSIELFQTAPLSSFETLFGKSISFFVVGGVLAAALTGLIILVLHTPMQGTWTAYAAVVAILLYGALGLGFLISTISETDTQAVQYSMIVLLASIFFTGFFIALHRLATPVYLVSALLPATWGTEGLQYVMLRGEAISILSLAVPFVLATFYYLLAWLRMRKLMTSV